MTELFDVAAIGNAIVDVIAPADEDFISAEGLARGAMTLVDQARGSELYARMAPGVETSGGSAANTVAAALRPDLIHPGVQRYLREAQILK